MVVVVADSDEIHIFLSRAGHSKQGIEFHTSYFLIAQYLTVNGMSVSGLNKRISMISGKLVPSIPHRLTHLAHTSITNEHS
jgi:hypothetical protein